MYVLVLILSMAVSMSSWGGGAGRLFWSSSRISPVFAGRGAGFYAHRSPFSMRLAMRIAIAGRPFYAHSRGVE